MTVAWESFNENYNHPLHFKEIDSFHAQWCECAGGVKVENLRDRDPFRKRRLFMSVKRI
jgi:hypothetical protein